MALLLVGPIVLPSPASAGTASTQPNTTFATQGVFVP